MTCIRNGTVRRAVTLAMLRGADCLREGVREANDVTLHHELMDMRVLRDARRGAVAMTADGKKLGTVGEVEGHFIKVCVPLGRDYWLKADYVTAETRDEVTFGFDKKDLGAYRVAKPAMAADPLVDQQDAVLSQQAQVEQRQRMERELAEQQRRIG